MSQGAPCNVMDTVEVGRLRERAIHLFRQPLVMGGQAGQKNQKAFISEPLSTFNDVDV